MNLHTFSPTSMKLYSDTFVDIVFGEGSLGFRIGESEDGNAIVAAFTEREGEDPFPLQLSSIIDVNYYIISLNSLQVIDFYKDEVKKLIRNGKRPLKVRFAKPIDSRVNLFLSQPWDESDEYLPIRRYDFTQFPDNISFYSRANFSLQDRALIPFYPGGELFLTDLRNYVFKGISDPLVRANCWKVLLKVYPLSTHQWAAKQQQNILAYREFVNEFVISQNARCGYPASTDIPSPIDTTWKNSTECVDKENESVWSRSFGDSDVREIIWKDVERTYSEMDFFYVHNRAVMARLLYVFCKLNSYVLYVQGMNELLAPLLYAFAEGESQLEQEVSEGVEADTFFAFSNLMSEMRDLFLRQMDKTTSGIGGALKKMSDCVRRIMPEVWERMSALAIEPQFFAVRWITTLYSREFELKETLRVWDSIFADPKRFMFSYCLGVALLHHIKDELVECEFAQFIQKLQNYHMPDTEEILRLANKIRLEELLFSYEESHPGYTKRMSRAGHELHDGMSPKRNVKRISFPFIKKPASPGSPRSPRLAFFSEDYDYSVSEQKSPCVVCDCLIEQRTEKCHKEYLRLNKDIIHNKQYS